MDHDSEALEKHSMQERVGALETRLTLLFVDKDIAHKALTHKSYCNEHRDEQCGNNERLEFLGDAVVDLAIGQRLMERFPHATEGELSKLRAFIVNEEGLARVARAINLGELLFLGRGESLTGGRDKPSVLADALEAVIGAIYLSNGMPATLTFIDRFFGEVLDGVANGSFGQDYKSMLQEDTQNRLRASPRYRVISEAGPDHEKIFEVEVSIGMSTYARSTGRSKKEAEQAAAREALALIDRVS